MTHVWCSTLTVSSPNPGGREKIKVNFIFALLCGGSKGFMKALKAFIKPSGAPQRSVKRKIFIDFFLIFISIQLSEIRGTGWGKKSKRY